MKIMITGSILATFLISSFLIRTGIENKIIGNEGIISNEFALLLGVIVMIYTIWRYKNRL